MIRISVLHSSAEARNKLVHRLRELTTENPSELEILPRLEYRPVSLGEIKYNQLPDICIIGSQMALEDQSSIANIKATLGKTAIVVALEDDHSNLQTVDRLLRHGADDTFSLTSASEDFLKRLITLTREAPPLHSAKLVLVDSGKGGLGTTTITALVGDLLHREKKEVCLIDCDYRSQDLSRFLQAAPFINSQLQNMLEGARPVTEEFVGQALVNVWEGSTNVWLMPPPPDSEALLDPHSNYARIFLNIIESISQQVDFIVADISPIHGPIQRTFYRAANTVCYVVDNDPASIYASVDQIESKSNLLSPHAEVMLIQNKHTRYGVRTETLRRQLSQILSRTEIKWSGQPIPVCHSGARWPASGDSFISLASTKAKKACKSIVDSLLDAPKNSTALIPHPRWSLFEEFCKKFTTRGQEKPRQVEHSPRLQLTTKAEPIALPHNGLDPDVTKDTSIVNSDEVVDKEPDISELVTAPSVIAL